MNSDFFTKVTPDIVYSSWACWPLRLPFFLLSTCFLVMAEIISRFAPRRSLASATPLPRPRPARHVEKRVVFVDVYSDILSCTPNIFNLRLLFLICWDQPSYLFKETLVLFCCFLSSLFLLIIHFTDFCSLFSLINTYLGFDLLIFSTFLKWKCSSFDLVSIFMSSSFLIFCRVSKLPLIPSSGFFILYFYFF